MNKDFQQELNVEVVEKIFRDYPKMEWLIFAGTVSKKSSREILGIDRYEFESIYLDLLEAGAVYGSGTCCYRATPNLKEYMANRPED